MIYIIISMLLATLLGITLDWPLWLVLSIIATGSTLSYLESKDCSWTAPLAIIATIILTSIISVQALHEKMPLTSSRIGDIWKSYDVNTAARLTDPAIKAKEALLNLQFDDEDKSAAKIKRIYREKNPEEALNRIRQIEDKGYMIRDSIISNAAPNEKNASLMPTTSIKVQQISRLSGAIDDYTVISFIRTAHEIDIQCQDGLRLEGINKGNEEYAGKWSQRASHGSFRIKFKGVNHADGAIEVMEGNIRLMILPL